jgi:Tol biopolymer transport system component
MDPETLEVRGAPGPVLENVTTNEGAFGTAHYSVSNNGKLVYMEGSAVAVGYGIVRVDRQGEIASLSSEEGVFYAPALSPDGRFLAASVLPGGSGANGDLWVEDLERGVRTRLTFGEGDDTTPVWSPDGEWIYFASRDSGSYNLHRVAADGSEQAVQLTDDENAQYPNAVSPDGRWLIYSENSSETLSDLMMLPLEGDGEPEVFLQTPLAETGARLSPNGRWLAYHSNESGQWEVYVRPFPEGRGEWKISSEISSFPRWSPTGDELFYRTLTGLSVAAVDTSGDSFRAKRSEALIEGNFVGLFPSWDFDVFPDAESFVMFQGRNSSEAVDHIVMITNWFPKLEETFATQSQ